MRANARGSGSDWAAWMVQMVQIIQIVRPSRDSAVDGRRGSLVASEHGTGRRIESVAPERT